jgi:hypothetical protein
MRLWRLLYWFSIIWPEDARAPPGKPVAMVFHLADVGANVARLSA